MKLTEDIVLDAIEFGMFEWSQFDWNNAMFNAKVMSDRSAHLVYNGTLEPRNCDDSYPKWYAEIKGDCFYLLTISIPESMRNVGHGSSLYMVIEHIAAALGCSEIRQTPSGWTGCGDLRRVYLHRRGWLSDGAEVFKRLEAS
jgi:hypothetical protein